MCCAERRRPSSSSWPSVTGTEKSAIERKVEIWTLNRIYRKLGVLHPLIQKLFRLLMEEEFGFHYDPVKDCFTGPAEVENP